jgi:hypothetical protein
VYGSIRDLAEQTVARRGPARPGTCECWLPLWLPNLTIEPSNGVRRWRSVSHRPGKAKRLSAATPCTVKVWADLSGTLTLPIRCPLPAEAGTTAGSSFRECLVGGPSVRGRPALSAGGRAAAMPRSRFRIADGPRATTWPSPTERWGTWAGPSRWMKPPWKTPAGCSARTIRSRCAYVPTSVRSPSGNPPPPSPVDGWRS